MSLVTDFDNRPVVGSNGDAICKIHYSFMIRSSLKHHLKGDITWDISIDPPSTWTLKNQKSGSLLKN